MCLGYRKINLNFFVSQISKAKRAAAPRARIEALVVQVETVVEVPGVPLRLDLQAQVAAAVVKLLAFESAQEQMETPTSEVTIPPVLELVGHAAQTAAA